jgi:hypothetical protein
MSSSITATPRSAVSLASRRLCSSGMMLPSGLLALGTSRQAAYLAVAGGQIERLDRQAGARIGGNFERFQPERFEQLQHQVIGR